MHLNLPNKITLSRICLIPFIMFFIMPFPTWLVEAIPWEGVQPSLQWLSDFIGAYGTRVGAVIFILAAATDSIDGYIARKNKQITNLGIFLDPIADKLLIAAALIALCQYPDLDFRLSGWAAVIFIGREFIVTALRLVAAADGVVISAGKWGKIKTVTQIIAIAAILLKNWPLTYLTDFRFDRVMIFVALLTTIYSGYDYFKRNKHVLQVKAKEGEN